MRRETQAGLIVATAFLCVTGALIGLRLRTEPDQVNAAPPIVTVAAAHTPTNPPDPPPPPVPVPAPPPDPAPVPPPDPAPPVLAPPPAPPPPAPPVLAPATPSEFVGPLLPPGPVVSTVVPAQHTEPAPPVPMLPAPVPVVPPPAPVAPPVVVPAPVAPPVVPPAPVSPPVVAPPVPMAPVPDPAPPALAPAPPMPAPVAPPPVVAPPAPVEPPPPVPMPAPVAPPAPAPVPAVPVPAAPAPLTIAPAQPLPATMAEAAPVVPPAPRAVVPPRTDSYDETLHTVKAGDTLATISQQYYLTEKYTQALLWYNHDQPMGAESRITEVNRLTPGQVLRVPPLRVLERKYPHTISGLANVAPASEVRPASVNPPSPNALPGLQAPPSGTYPLYRVRDPGELLADIAKHTLGASAQAERIRQLNPALAPQAPIPGRTILRLPGEARIDDADKP